MKNSKNVLNYMFGADSIKALDTVLSPRRKSPQDFVVFVVDWFFRDKTLVARLPHKEQDEIIFVDTTDEPTTDQINGYMDRLRAKSSSLPVAIVGIGGGCTLDSAKAISNLYTNPGFAEDYQGWDLVQNPGVFKVGVPTVSGTGAEASRTCVMMNHKKNLKLGMNSEHTIYDQLILDPELIKTVPRDQYFYTGMDTYIHCVESLKGNYRHAVGDAFSREAMRLCEEVFLDDDMYSESSRQKLMVASYLGGCAIANSFVGLVHPFSAGLSMVFHTHHCIGNCIVMDAMDEYYPDAVKDFRKMMAKQNIRLPKGITQGLSEQGWENLYQATVVHEKPLANALGPRFKEILTREKVREIFSRM